MPVVGGNGQLSAYNVDIVMCIDVTGSMSGILDEVKAKALSLYPKFVAEMQKFEKSVEQLRIKVIAFRDYGVDSEPMLESKFFVLDEEKEEFLDFVSALEPLGGGDTPESALEAISLAFKSDWVNTPGTIKRYVTLVYTDAPAAPLGINATAEGYPADMPKDMAEFRELWDHPCDEQVLAKPMWERGRRLVVYAPDVEPWTDIGLWDGGVIHQASEAGRGCDDVDMDVCIKLLVNSI